jgi:hypothetical protein
MSTSSSLRSSLLLSCIAIIGTVAFLQELLGMGDDLIIFSRFLLVGLQNQLHIFVHGFTPGDVIESSLPIGDFTCQMIKGFWQCNISALGSVDHLASKCSSGNKCQHLLDLAINM